MNENKITTEYDPSLGGYVVFRDGERIGHVTKTRSAVRRSDGNRVLSGKQRTVWVTKGNEYPTRKAAIEALIRRNA